MVQLDDDGKCIIARDTGRAFWRCGNVCLVLILLGPISQCCSDFDEQTSAAAWAGFYIAVGIVLSGFLLRAYVLWSCVPSGAKEGYIQIDDAKVVYEIGRHRREVRFSEVADVEPVICVQGKHLGALWLSFSPIAPGVRSQRAGLQRKMRKRPATPIEGNGWLALPVALFDHDDVTKALELIQSTLISKRQPVL